MVGYLEIPVWAKVPVSSPALADDYVLSAQQMVLSIA